MISKNFPRQFCSEPIENIENYQDAVNDSEHMWHCHHRNEICLANQSRLDGGITPRKQLIADGMYYHRPACELIFLRHDEHLRLHRLHPSEETKRKMSERLKGRHFSEEHRHKIGESRKGKSLSEEHRRKIAEGNKGKHSGSMPDWWKRRISEGRKKRNGGVA